MTNHRLTLAAAIAVLAASLSLSSLLIGTSWLVASVGAVAAVALAATLTRLTTIQAAVAGLIVVLAGVVPVLAGYGWAGAAGAVVVLGLTAASATGARLLRAFAACATYVTVPFLYLNAVFAGQQSWAAVIPTSRSLAALARLPGQAGSMFKFSPPIPTTRPVEFITVGGVTLIAICVDVLAVRFRRPALAGLPLLLLFSVPVASSLKSFGFLQTLLFGIAVAAYLALLSSDGRQRLRMWGRLVTIRRPHAMDDTGQGPDTRQVAASGRRVGLTAVALAMVVPIFLAGTPPKDLFAKTSTGGVGGGLAIPGGLAPLDNVAQLLTQKPRLVLTYTTTYPKPQDQYLQIFALNYDYGADGKWLPSASSGKAVSGTRLPFQQVPGLTAVVPVVTARTAVSVTGPIQTPLPLPYAPVQVSGTGSSLIETSGTLMVFGNPIRNTQYSVVSREVVPTTADLEIPGAYPQSVQKVYTSYRGPDRAAAAADRAGPHAGRRDAIGQGRGPAELAYLQRVLVLAEGEVAGLRPVAGELPDHGPARRLRAVRARVRRAGQAARHPGAGRGRLHRWHAGAAQHLAGHHRRRARLAGALFPWRGLGQIRADAGRQRGRGRSGHRHSALVHDEPAAAWSQPNRPAGQHQPVRRSRGRGQAHAPDPRQATPGRLGRGRHGRRRRVRRSGVALHPGGDPAAAGRSGAGALARTAAPLAGRLDRRWPGECRLARVP